MKSVVRKRLLSLSSQQQSAQSQEAQRGRCGFRNGFVVNQHLGDAVFRDLCHARLNFGVAGGNIQAEQIQIEISSQLSGFDGSQFNSSASGKAARIQYAGEDDCFSVGPEAGDIRSGQGAVFFRRKRAEIQCEVTSQPKGIAGFKYQLGIAFQRERIDVEVSYSRCAKQGASRFYDDLSGGSEIGLGGGPGDRSGIFSDDGIIAIALRIIAVRRAIYRPVVGVSVNSVSCRSAPDVGGSLGKTRGKAA